jgi:hypothetical protein
MWFCFGILTLIASTFWSLKWRLATHWSGVPERIGGNLFSVRKRRNTYGPDSVRFGTAAPAGLHFRVRAEGVHDRFFKWFGVCTEIQTRDPIFDQRLYVESDARAVAILLKRNAQLRSALIEIFAYAKERGLLRVCLRCSNQRVWLEFSRADEGALSNVKMDLAPLLSAISAGLKCIDIPNEYRRDRFVWRAAAALAFSTSTLVLGVFGILRTGLGSTDIIEPKLLIMACLIPAFLITALGTKILVAWLAASSRAHTVILECLLVGGLGLVLATYALAREANVEFDFHPATRVVSNVELILEMSGGGRHGGGRSFLYYIHCRDWRPGHEGRLRLKISASDFYELSLTHTAAIYVRPGLFGFEWVEKIEPVERPS